MSKRVIYALNIITLAAWVSVGLGAAVGFSAKQDWTVAFPVKPEPLRLMTSIDIEPADAASVEDSIPGQEIALPQLMPIIAADPAPAPPPMPEIAPMAALPEIPELPAPVIRKTATQVAPSVPKTAAKPSNSAATANAKKPTGNNPPTTATTLSFGSGAGRQPAPAYPLQSRRSNQQGTVVIEFIVGTDGKVLSAWVKTPCPYELLNNAALSTIRSRWKFATGEARRYKIPIIFRLN